MALVDEIMSFLTINMPGKTVRGYQMSDEPDVQIVVKKTPMGEPSVRSLVVENHIFIMNRAGRAASATAEADSRTIYTLLNGKVSDFGATPIQICKAVDVPYFVGPDENGRPNFACDYIVRSKGL